MSKSPKRLWRERMARGRLMRSSGFEPLPFVAIDEAGDVPESAVSNLRGSHSMSRDGIGIVIDEAGEGMESQSVVYGPIEKPHEYARPMPGDFNGPFNGPFKGDPGDIASPSQNYDHDAIENLLKRQLDEGVARETLIMGIPVRKLSRRHLIALVPWVEANAPHLMLRQPSRDCPLRDRA